MRGMSQPSMGTTTLLNFFDISTASTQLLSFYMNGGFSPTIIYANTQVANGNGPAISSASNSVWTYYTVVVQRDKVVMSANTDPVNPLTYYINNVNTVGQIYNIWGSNSLVNTAGGVIYEMRFAGEFFLLFG